MEIGKKAWVNIMQTQLCFTANGIWWKKYLDI